MAGIDCRTMPRMFEWPEELQMVRDAVRTFVDNEIRPHREELERPAETSFPH